MTVREAEVLLDVSRQRIHQLIHAGKLEAISRYAPVAKRRGNRLSMRREWLVSAASVQKRKDGA